MQLEGDVLYLGTVIEVFDLQQNIAVADVLGREQVGHFAAYHHLNQLGTAEFTNRLGADILTITEDGNFICDGVYLIQLVRDDNNGDVFTLESTDEVVQHLDLVLRDGGSRFVHDNKLCVKRDSLDDFDHLNICSFEHLDLGARIVIESPAVKDLLARIVHGFPVDRTRSGFRIAADEYVFRNGKFLDRAEFLIDHRDARVYRFLY